MSLSKKLLAWAYYDFANSAYVLIYQTFLLPILFASIFESSHHGLTAWGLSNGLSTLIGVVASIFIGRFADKYERLFFFKWSIILSFIGMLAIVEVIAFRPAELFIVYLLANSVFIISLALSDSILPFIATKEKAYVASGFAWGFGYVGGVIGLIIVIALQHFFGSYSAIVFLSTALFYGIFSFYSLNGLRKVTLNEYASEKLSSTQSTTTSLLSPSQKTILFVGYWLISECITVIILFFSIFASEELHLSTPVIGLCLLIVQLIAFPATWYGGVLVKRYGNLKMLGLTIFVWGIIILSLVLHPSLLTLGLAVLLCGLVLGNSQSFLRAQYSTLINRAGSGFQFGLYSIVGEASVLIGPVAFGLGSDYLHSEKLPIIILYFFMVIGFILVWKIIRQADETPAFSQNSEKVV